MSFAELKSMTSARFRSAPIEDHPLFRALDAQAVGRDGAREIALQIFHVVDFFPRLLAALCARIDDHRLRMALVENLFEEHGRMDAARVHVVTYRDFLHALSIDDASIDASRPSIHVVVYTRAMFDVASRAPLGEALAVMGVVEEIVARVSPIVARYGRRHAADALGTHFSVHEELDLAHADEIYDLAAPHLLDAREDVLRGLEIGRYLQERLYSDLLDLVRSVHVPSKPSGRPNPQDPTYPDLGAGKAQGGRRCLVAGPRREAPCADWRSPRSSGEASPLCQRSWEARRACATREP